MPTSYSKELCDKMVSKLLAQDSPGVTALSRASGISKSALYKWLNKYKSREGAMSENNELKRPQNWSASEKLKAVIATATMTEEEIGSYCRQHGIYANHLTDWHRSMLEGLKPSTNKEQKTELYKLKTENKSLKSELTRKEKALAETSALLILKKKANLIWGDGKED